MPFPKLSGKALGNFFFEVPLKFKTALPFVSQLSYKSKFFPHAKVVAPEKVNRVSI
jgi:hypothetical protein